MQVIGWLRSADSLLIIEGLLRQDRSHHAVDGFANVYLPPANFGMQDEMETIHPCSWHLHLRRGQ
jgi:hypothetical protein